MNKKYFYSSSKWVKIGLDTLPDCGELRRQEPQFFTQAPKLAPVSARRLMAEHAWRLVVLLTAGVGGRTELGSVFKPDD